MKATPTMPALQAEPDTKGKILAAACRLFGRHSYEGVGIRAIARDADLNTQAIYYYFGSKRNLYRLCRQQLMVRLDHLVRGWVDIIDQHRPLSSGTSLSNLVAKLVSYELDALLKDVDLIPGILAEIGRSIGHDNGGGSVFGAIVEPRYAGWLDIYRIARPGQGGYREHLWALMASCQSVSTLYAYEVTARMNTGDIDLPAFAEEIRRLVTNSLVTTLELPLPG